ncbi:MAG TPA: class D sortase [Bryobacteraceae bacterium]|nr:class D sortase [Bryobacteraceae bacterium]
MHLKNWRVWLGSVLLAGGAALLAWCGWVWYQAGLAQRHARESLNRPPVQAHVAREHPPAIHRGDVVGELAIPRLHLSVMVLEGADDQILKLAAGHIQGTALAPGTGNIGIAAHRDTFFRPLRSIRPEDLITLKTPSGVSRFQVSDTEVVPPTDVQVLDRAPGRDLTLVTCYPFHYIGPAPKRFIVHARQVS